MGKALPRPRAARPAERTLGVHRRDPARVRKLQDACRAGGVELIHIRVKYLTPDCRDGQPLALAGRRRPSGRRARRRLPRNRGPAPGDEMVVDKTSAGTFNSTSLDQILRNMRIDRLWVTGS
jgi:nicotinamidase-related amidase